MSKYNSHLVLLLAAALLAACESTPKPELAPEPQGAAVEAADNSAAAVVTETETAGATGIDAAPVLEAAPQPEPVDVDQLAYAAAIAELKSGAIESALGELIRLGEAAPDKPRLFTNLGLAHFQLQQFELAEQAFQRAIENDSEDAVAHNHLGILLRRKGEFQNALQAYQKAIEIDEKYARAHLNLGILFDLYLQDLEKALQHYRKYQELTSDDNAQVAGWIVDIERRLNTTSKQTQG